MPIHPFTPQLSVGRFPFSTLLKILTDRRERRGFPGGGDVARLHPEPAAGLRETGGAGPALSPPLPAFYLALSAPLALALAGPAVASIGGPTPQPESGVAASQSRLGRCKSFNKVGAVKLQSRTAAKLCKQSLWQSWSSCKLF